MRHASVFSSKPAGCSPAWHSRAGPGAIENPAVCALLISVALFTSEDLHASSTKLSETQARAVEKATIGTHEEEKQRQAIAVMLAEYEIKGRKLLDGLDDNTDRNEVDQQASTLLISGEKIMGWARFRLNSVMNTWRNHWNSRKR